MRYTAKAGDVANVATACLVVHRRAAADVASALDCREAMRLALAGTENRVGAVARVFRAGRPGRLLIVGSDKAAAKADSGKAAPEATFRKDVAAAAKAIASLDVADATLAMDGFTAGERGLDWRIRTALAAVSSTTYRFDAYKSKPKPAKLRRVGVLAADRTALRVALRQAQALDEGLAFAKDLGNQPPNVCTPGYVADAAQTLASHEKVAVTVVEEA